MSVCMFNKRQVITASRDRTIKIWNTLGECKQTLVKNAHSDWVSQVRISAQQNANYIVSCSWDKLIKVWDLQTCSLVGNFSGHTGYVNSLCVSPDGSLCASGGKDGLVMLWSLIQDKMGHFKSLDVQEEIFALEFAPCRTLLAVATYSSLRIWDLENNSWTSQVSAEDSEIKTKPSPVSLAWSKDASVLFAGFTDNHIRVYNVS